jgi:hypothetical protein
MLRNARLHAFLTSTQAEVRDALVRSLYHTSLYMRLIFANKEEACTKVVNQALNIRLMSNPKRGPPSSNSFMANYTMAS